MFRFEDPTYLYLLISIPLFVLYKFYVVRKQRKNLRKIGDENLLKELMPDVSVWRPHIKFAILLTALALSIIMLARPQFGTRISNEKRTGIETIIAMDISNSMRAQDVTPSRLDRCKMMVENLVDNFSDDKIGLVVFAGDAFVQLPITSDYVSAKMFLGSIDPSMMMSQGTDIATAINMAANSFTRQEGIGKAIIVITDGEDHEGGALEAAKEAKERGMRVYVLGVGSVNGAPIPILGTNDYMKDNTGNIVMTALNADMCKEIAAAGGGSFIHVENSSNAQEQLNAELDKLAKKEIETTVYSEFDEQFQAFGIIILLLLILEVCILERKNPLFKGFSLFGKTVKSSMFIIALLIPATMCAQTDRQFVRNGNKEYRKGNFAEAEVAYRKALEKNKTNPQASYNLANALFSQRKDSASVEQYEVAIKNETNPMRKSWGYHNIGVICQQHKMYGEAIEAYKNALRLNPADDRTRYNLELCRRQQKQQQQQQQQQQQDKNQDKKDENKEQQKDKKEQDKKEQDKKEDKKEQEQQKQPQQPKEDKNKMSKENAEQLLKAVMQKEKNTQERLQKAMQEPNKRQLEKNW